MRKVQKGNVSIKIWDIGGQPRFRTMWERYCRGVNVIVYMVDAADHDKIEQTTRELHELLDKPSLQVTTSRTGFLHAAFLQGMPVLVLGNKNDLPNALDVDSLTDKLNLDRIDDREVAVYTISCKNKNNLDVVLQVFYLLDFFLKRAHENCQFNSVISVADDKSKEELIEKSTVALLRLFTSQKLFMSPCSVS